MNKKDILFGIFATLCVSCSNQDIEESLLGSEHVQVTAGIADSRVSFNEADNMTYAYWQDGDTINLSTPTQENLTYVANISEEESTVVTFSPKNTSLKDIDGETVYACYPATDIMDKKVSLPVTNTWTDAQPLPFAYAISNIENSKVNLQFKHVFSFLKLTLPAKALNNISTSDGDKSVHRVLVKSDSETLGIVSGTFNFENKGITINEGANAIELSLGTAFNPLKETERSVYIPILPQAGNQKIAISLLHDYEGGEDVLMEMEKQTPAEGFIAGYVYTLTLYGNSSVVIEGESGEIHLAEAGTLSNYITDENKYTIKSLKISGLMNGDDFLLLHEMSTGDGTLTELDILDATVVEGGTYSNFYTQDDALGNSFFSCTKLEKIQLPKNLTSMGDGTFSDCTSLTDITIPSQVTSIGYSAFHSCESLTTVIIPEDSKLMAIGDDAFWRCDDLQHIVLPESLTIIGSTAFEGCTTLTKINIPDAVTTIETYAFWGCSSLAHCSMGAGVTSIGEGAFSHCTALTSIVLPEGITKIEENVFMSCESLQEIIIPDAVTAIGEHAFQGCVSLKRVSLSSNLSTIGDYAFNNCQALEELIVPDAVTSIGFEAFIGCTSLKDVSLGNGLIEIGIRAFAICESLEYIEFPESLERIGQAAFERCTSLAFAKNAIMTDSHIFARCTALEKITISDKTTEIGEEAFISCDSLRNVIIPDGVTKIRKLAFYGCISLTEIIIPDAVKTIEESAFYGCTSLLKVKLPNTITKIDQDTFTGCNSLTDIVIPDAVVTIDEYAFYYCTSLEKITLGKSVASIGKGAFIDTYISECISYAVTPPIIQTAMDSETFRLDDMVMHTTKLYVPKGSLDVYKESDWATYFNDIIELEK